MSNFTFTERILLSCMISMFHLLDTIMGHQYDEGKDNGIC